MSLEPLWLAEAWRELGQSEISGPRHNPRITAFFKELGHERHARDEVAWCAAFVGACLERSGLKSTRSLMARSYARWGDELDAEVAGAVAVLSRGPNPALGHVGFLVGWSSEKVWLLGGNQKDQVSVASYERRRLVALRWPPMNVATMPDEPRKAGGAVFAAALRHVLEMEGGYTDDPHDPGGPTNKGITLGNFAAWRKKELDGRTREDLIRELKSISDDEVGAIYRARYWKVAKCAELPPPAAFFHFDAAVNHGPTGAARLLQEAAGAEVDGIIGPETKGKVAAMPILKLLALYAELRRKRYRALPHFWRFGRGWLRRVDKTLERARALAGTERSTSQNAGGKPAGSVSQSSGEREMSQTTNQSAPKWWGESLTIWGALTTAAATLLPIIAPLLGIELSAENVKQLGEETFDVIQALGALFGTVLTIYGRARASQPLMRREMMLKV